MMRARDVGHRHSRDGRVEVEKGFVSDNCSDLGTEAAGAQVLMNDQAAASAAHAVEHHFFVPWLKRAQIDNVRTESLGGRLAARHHRAPGDDGDPVAFASLLRPSEWKD